MRALLSDRCAAVRLPTAAAAGGVLAGAPCTCARCRPSAARLLGLPAPPVASWRNSCELVLSRRGPPAKRAGAGSSAPPEGTAAAAAAAAIAARPLDGRRMGTVAPPLPGGLCEGSDADESGSEPAGAGCGTTRARLRTWNTARGGESSCEAAPMPLLGADGGARLRACAVTAVSCFTANELGPRVADEPEPGWECGCEWDCDCVTLGSSDAGREAGSSDKPHSLPCRSILGRRN